MSRYRAEQIDTTFKAISELPYTIEVTWHANVDACGKCLILDGETWQFPTLSGTLTHPEFGAVYDLDADLSLMHPHCHCFLEVNPIIDLENSQIFQSLKKMLGEANRGMPSNIQDATRQVETLRVETAHARGELRELEYILYRTLSVLNRMGMSPEIEAVIQKIQKLILIIRVLHSTFILMESGTPFGMALGVISGIATVLNIGDLLS